jgi:hypothetical protein
VKPRRRKISRATGPVRKSKNLAPSAAASAAPAKAAPAAASDAGKKVELKSGYALPHDNDVGAVIVGFDREINYHKVSRLPLSASDDF